MLLRELRDFAKQEFGIELEVAVSSPGRLDFLNTHQDYKGLPVVSVGVNLRMYMGGKVRQDKVIRIASKNLKEEGVEYRDEFDIDHVELQGGRWFGDYLRGAIIALREKGYKLHGMDVVIRSEIPIGGGLGSSGAFTVAFIGLLNEAFNLGMTKSEIAELAYIAEHDIMGIPCGRLDQYGSAYGGVVRIEVKPPFRVEEIPFREGTFVVLDSGIKHSTADIHPRRQADIDEGLRILMSMPDIPADLRIKLGFKYYEPRWEEITEEELAPYLMQLPENPAKRILYTIKAHRSTELALRVMRGEKPSFEEALRVLGENWRSRLSEVYEAEGTEWKLRFVGLIMNQQHEMLMDLYDLSLPELERIRDGALRAGALGVKLSGAGLGGALIALARDEVEGRKVLEAGLEAGASRGWVVRIDEGLRREL